MNIWRSAIDVDFLMYNIWAILMLVGTALGITGIIIMLWETFRR